MGTPPRRPVHTPSRWRAGMRVPVMIAGAAALVLAGVAIGALVARGGGDGDGGPSSLGRQPATPETAPSPSPAATTTPATPSPTPSPTPPASGTPAPRNVNGLMVVDETWVGRVVEAGGLRIRRAPRVEPGNVVGSVAQGTEVNVEGRVLNGQEAEPGKGTVWLIVGPSQYIYAAPGYVERVR